MRRFLGEPSRRRGLATAFGFGLVLAAGETLAAASVAARELELYALQALLALGAGLLICLLPLSTRVLATAVLAGITAFHAAYALHDVDARLSAGDVTFVVLLGALAAAASWTCSRPRDGTAMLERETLLFFGAGYLAQALWTACFLFPQTDAGARAIRLASLASVGATCVALVAMRGLLARRAGAGALTTLLLLALLPWLGRLPVFWWSHRALPVTRSASQGAPDVFLIVLDTVRADRTSLHGHPRPTTPCLERFAERATVYERAQSQGVWTVPGHASLFTGLYPSEHGADWKDGVHWCRPLRPEAITLAERFAHAGYRTACIAGNRFFSPSFGLDQGFEWITIGRSPSVYLWVPALAMGMADLWGGIRARQRIGALERTPSALAPEINALALDWLERTQERGPRFLVLNFMETHDRLRRISCAAPLFGEGRSCIPDNLEDPLGIVAGERVLAPEEAARLEDWYDSELACLDLHLGELFDALEQHGLLDGALVAVTADHGHLLGEHDAFNHEAEVWQELTHVPLILKRPGQRAAGRVARAVETADLAFVLPFLAGVDPAQPPPADVGRTQEGLRARIETALAFPLEEPPASEPHGARELGRLAVSQAPHRASLEPLSARYATPWTSIVDGPTKFFIDGSDRIQVAEPVPGVREVLREPTELELAQARACLSTWRSGLLPPLAGAQVSSEDEEAAERARQLEAQGYGGR